MKHAIELYDAATDDWIGTATAPASRITFEGDESYRYVSRLTLPRGLSRKQRQQAMLAAEHTMRWNCHCEHDCCGCSFGWSRARIVNARTLSVQTYVSHNI